MRYSIERTVQIYHFIIDHYILDWREFITDINTAYEVDELNYVNPTDVLIALDIPRKYGREYNCQPIDYRDACIILDHIMDSCSSWHQLVFQLGFTASRNSFLCSMFNPMKDIPDMEN